MLKIIRRIRFSTCLAALTVLALLTISNQVVVKADNRHSEQVIFSGVGFGVVGGVETPFGFWIWCQNEASGNGLYGRDKACEGAMYVYALGLTKGVFGFGSNGGVVENFDGTYTMDVHSADGLIHAFLHNLSATVTYGPSNGVEVRFVAPGGGGVSTNAVVNVTGKE